MSSPTPIGLAVVTAHGRAIVGVRDASQSLSGLAEFPGGKCEPYESIEACVVRECLEETGLSIQLVRELLVQPWSYDHGAVELHFWLCQLEAIAADLPRCAGRFRWVDATELQALDFPPANQACLELLPQLLSQ